VSTLFGRAGALLVALGVFIAPVSATPRVSLPLIIDNPAVVPETVLTTALAEAKSLWARYRVDVGVFGQAESVLDCDRMSEAAVTVTFNPREAAAATAETLGDIRFDPRGVPERRLVLYYGAVVQIARSAEVLGADASRWPAHFAEEVVGRTLGRALAHELGHFLLRWMHHSAIGLMRAEHHSSELADSRRNGFFLTTVEEARLQIAVDDLSRRSPSCARLADGER
jgi:hypothetical protein